MTETTWVEHMQTLQKELERTEKEVPTAGIPSVILDDFRRALDHLRNTIWAVRDRSESRLDGGPMALSCLLSSPAASPEVVEFRICSVRPVVSQHGLCLAGEWKQAGKIRTGYPPCVTSDALFAIEENPMRKAAALACSIVILAVLAMAQAKSDQQSQIPGKQLMQEIWNGWATLDTANVSHFYDKEPNDVFFDLAPLKYKGWAEYEAGVNNVLAQWQAMKATVSQDAQVSYTGSVYWGIATVHLDITAKDGNQMALDTRLTVVWRKKGKQWLIVHEHVSAPLQPPPKQQKQ